MGGTCGANVSRQVQTTLRKSCSLLVCRTSRVPSGLCVCVCVFLLLPSHRCNDCVCLWNSLYRRKIIEEILSGGTLPKGYIFQVSLITQLKARGYKVEEVRRECIVASVFFLFSAISFCLCVLARSLSHSWIACLERASSELRKSSATSKDVERSSHTP